LKSYKNDFVLSSEHSNLKLNAFTSLRGLYYKSLQFVIYGTLANLIVSCHLLAETNILASTNKHTSLLQCFWSKRDVI